LSAVEWLIEAGDALHNYRILFIAIDSEQGSRRSGSTWSWQRQISAPVEALKNVRTSSQEFRDNLELQMILKYLNQEKLNAQPALFPFRTTLVAPLSWHLNKVQMDAIHQALDRDRVTRQQESELEELRKRYELLTPREREVLVLVVSGLLNKQIADKLGTCETTVKIHRGRVMNKMGAQSLAELVRMTERLEIPTAKDQSAKTK